MCCSRPQPVACLPQVLKVAILAEKYAVDYTWYVDTILNLIRIAGDYVSEEVWYRVIQIVINQDDVQGYAAKTVFEVSMKIYAITDFQCLLQQLSHTAEHHGVIIIEATEIKLCCISFLMQSYSAAKQIVLQMLA